jgi:hypothetical protein
MGPSYQEFRNWKPAVSDLWTCSPHESQESTHDPRAGCPFGPDALATTVTALVTEVAPVVHGLCIEETLSSPAPYVHGIDNAFVIRERRGT